MPVAEPELQHSKIGIASFAVAVLMFLSFLTAALYLEVAWDAQSRERWFHSEGLVMWQIVVVWILPIPVHAVGFVLGSVSLFFPTRKKLFPLLGIALNGLFGFAGLIPWLWLALHAPGVK